MSVTTATLLLLLLIVVEQAASAAASTIPRTPSVNAGASISSSKRGTVVVNVTDAARSRSVHLLKRCVYFDAPQPSLLITLTPNLKTLQKSYNLDISREFKVDPWK